MKFPWTNARLTIAMAKLRCGAALQLLVFLWMDSMACLQNDCGNTRTAQFEPHYWPSVAQSEIVCVAWSLVQEGSKPHKQEPNGELCQFVMAPFLFSLWSSQFEPWIITSNYCFVCIKQNTTTWKSNTCSYQMQI